MKYEITYEIENNNPNQNYNNNYYVNPNIKKETSLNNLIRNNYFRLKEVGNQKTNNRINKNLKKNKSQNFLCSKNLRSDNHEKSNNHKFRRHSAALPLRRAEQKETGSRLTFFRRIKRLGAEQKHI